MNLRDLAKKHEEKLKKIKICLFDVDGILTNGQIYYSGEEVGFNRFFHTLDGYGLKLLKTAGIKVGVITGGNSLGVKKRFELLGIDYLYMGDEDKRSAFEDVLKKANLKAEQALYMGDEFFDLPLLIQAGFSATVKTASHEIQEVVDYVCERDSGMGCVREVIDMLRYAQGIVPKIPGYN